ncbi:MAG: hypothetical protein Kow0098_29730 [Ignavibacteriaceae bacterium]
MESVAKSLFSITVFFILFVLTPEDQIFSQTGENGQIKSNDPTSHKEIKDDNYLPVLRTDQQRSPAYKYSTSVVTTVQVNVDENGQNIIGDAANEPSIAVDPNDDNRIAIGWRQFNTVSSNFRQAGYGFSTDGGQTWTFPGVIEPGVFRSDPVLDTDAQGNFYYNSLTNSPEFMCHVFKSTDGGFTWSDGTFAQGGDKQWMTIDKTDGSGSGHIYAFWTSFFSVCFPGSFTRSTDNGFSFESCVTIPQDPYWGTLAVNPDGILFLGASVGDDFVVAKSTNAQDPNQIVSWDMATIVDLDGSITSGGNPNPGGLLGQTIIAVDTSGGIYDGNIYLLCSVDRHSNSDPADIMFAKSTDGGVTFSSPVRINDDQGTSAYQWFGTMSVSPNGRIDVVWLDTRDNPSNISALYYSFSTDGGDSWSPNERISDFFNSHLGWPNQNKMGDYFDMVSVSNGAHLAWAATFNGEQDVYYSFITDTTIIPVEFISFSGFIAGNVVTLEWITATELNNLGFEIERSVDRINWRTIGFKQGNGTTTEQKKYFYTDRLSGNNEQKLHYRLKQIDYDGEYEYSDVVEIKVAPVEFSLSQNYPNPFNPTTKIKYSIPSVILSEAKNLFITLKVYDVLGNEVATLVNEQKPSGEYEVEFNASELGSGVYFYTLKAGSFFQSRKMILLR